MIRKLFVFFIGIFYGVAQAQTQIDCRALFSHEQEYNVQFDQGYTLVDASQVSTFLKEFNDMLGSYKTHPQTIHFKFSTYNNGYYYGQNKIEVLSKPDSDAILPLTTLAHELGHSVYDQYFTSLNAQGVKNREAFVVKLSQEVAKNPEYADLKEMFYKMQSLFEKYKGGRVSTKISNFFLQKEKILQHLEYDKNQIITPFQILKAADDLTDHFKKFYAANKSYGETGRSFIANNIAFFRTEQIKQDLKQIEQYHFKISVAMYHLYVQPLADYRNSFKNKENIARSALIQTPYFSAINELFADLVTALYFNNPSALRVFGRHDMKIYKDREIMARDFSQKINFKGWNRASNQNEELRSYEILEPTRAALWSLLQKKKIRREDVPQIVGAYLEASNRLHQIGSYSRDPAIYNQVFFRLIVEELKKTNLWQQADFSQ